MAVSSVKKTALVLPILLMPAERTVVLPAKTSTRLPNVPASFFGIVLGFAGLGNAWRAAAAPATAR